MSHLKPLCMYGSSCYRKNPQHLLDYRHPKRNIDEEQEVKEEQGESSNKRLKADDSEKFVQTGELFSFYLTRIMTVKQDERNGFLSISISEILSPRFGQLEESAQFNYMFDVEWLIKQYDTSFRKLPLLIVFGNKANNLEIEQMNNQVKNYQNIKLCPVRLTNMFGTHHTKMMLLKYENGIRIVIHTANLVAGDWNEKTQGVWLSPLFPHLGPNHSKEDNSTTKFKSDLLDYLKSYNSKSISRWCEIIANHDLSTAKVFLIGSISGRVIGNEKVKFGHLKLRKVLSSFGPSSSLVDSNWPVIAQFSSIGSLGPKPETWLCSEFLSSLATTCRDGNSVAKLSNSMAKLPNLKLIFPSVDDVKKSLEGYQAGNSLPYSYKTAIKQLYLKSFMHKWKSDFRSRTEASPHIKSYLRHSPDHKRVSWFLLTSANLSKGAWGCLEKNGSQLAMLSYELGVLFVPKIFVIKYIQCLFLRLKMLSFREAKKYLMYWKDLI